MGPHEVRLYRTDNSECIFYSEAVFKCHLDATTVWYIQLHCGKDCGQEEKGATEDEMASVTQRTFEQTQGRQWRTGEPGMLPGDAVHGVAKSQTRLSDWSTTVWVLSIELKPRSSSWSPKMVLPIYLSTMGASVSKTWKSGSVRTINQKLWLWSCWKC